MQVHNEAAGPPTDIRRYLAILWRRKFWILVPLLVLSVGAFALAESRPSRYRATGEIIVNEPTNEGIPYLDSTLSDNAERTIRNEIELLDSRDTRLRVADEVGRQVAVSASNDGTSDVITLTVTGPDAEQAAADVNDFAHAYVDLRRADRQDQLEAARERVVDDRRSAQAAIQRLNRPIRQVEQQLAVTPPGPERDTLMNQRDQMRDNTSYQRTALNNQITELSQQIDQIDGALELTNGGIQVITEATVPRERYTPQPKKDVLVAATLALIMGLILAFAAEFGFDGVSTQEDIEETLPGDRFVGAIPEIPELAEDSLLDFGVDRTVGAESYRALAASIEFARLEKPVTVIHVTSPVQGEGKSTTAANLAAAFAETGARVAMVDADVRRPQLYRILGAANDVGLSAVLLGRASLEDALQEVPGVPGASLLSPGELPQNPTKLLYARRTEEVFDELRAAFDVVLVDGPPVLPVADALILTQFSDLTLLVVRSGATRRRALRRARNALGRVDAAGMAVVLNAAPVTGPDGYGYYGSYYYASASDDEGGGRRRRRRRRARSRRG